MKQTIEIEVPDGKKAVWKDNKVVFEDIKPQLPKTWEEFCENYPRKKDECYIDMSCQIVRLVYKIDRDKDLDKNLLPSKQAAEAHLALMQLHQLRDCYRQGWIPDWSDCENKYCIIYDSVYCNTNYNHSIAVHTHTNEFLTFQSREIAQEFLNNFKDLIEQAGDLI